MLNELELKFGDVYVWFWMGIVMNFLKEIDDDKEVLFDLGYWLKCFFRFKFVDVNVFWIE